MDLRLALRLARRELRGSLGGFRVFLACLALGVAAITGVGSVSDAMHAGIKRDARALLGGDVSVRLVHREIFPEARAALDRSGRVSKVATMRTMTRPTVGGRRTLVEMKAVDAAYPLFGSIRLSPSIDISTALSPIDGVHGVVIDPALLGRLQLDVGDRLSIGSEAFEIRAVIEKEPDRTIRFATFGPRVLISTEALASTGLIATGSLVNFHYRVDLPEGTDVEAWMNDLKAQFPKAGWRLRSTDTAAPGFDRFIDRVTQFLTLVGLTALLVGGVGIASAVRSFLDQRTGTIATLKCLGAPGRLIFATYLVQVLILATIGVSVGVTVGAAAPPVTARLLEGVFPVTIPLGIYWKPVLVATGFGYLTTLAFAVWPLGRARDVRAAQLFRALIVPPSGAPKRQYVLATALFAAVLATMVYFTTGDSRLATWFIGGALGVLLVFGGGTLGLLHLARALPSPSRPGLRLAVANLHRPGSPTPSIVLSLGLGLTVLVTVALVQSNMARQITQQMPKLAPSYFFIDIQPHQVDPFTKLVRSMPGISKLEHTPMVRGRIVEVAGKPVEQVKPDKDVAWAINGDRGLTYAATKPEGTEIAAGEWWPEDYSGPPLISFDANVARGIRVGLGDTITLNVLGREFTATIANLRHIDWATLAMNFVFVFAPGTLEAAPHSVISTVYADKVEAEEAVQTAVTEAFPNISAIRVKDALDNANRILAAVAMAVRTTAFVTLLAGVLVLAGAVVTGQHRRIYDAVVLKVLGATRRRILASYLAEYAILGLLTAAVACVVGGVIGRFIVTDLMRADFVLNASAILLTAAVSLACTIGLGLLGTWRALGLKVAPLLRND
ncbi:MAG: glycosyl transferase family 1 [Rhodospirillaceae bacterium]|nr:glycosyl transferase family 1 [Rhodospirillaceae bacterium]